MPYWSIAEWRARVGCSWCALGRPQVIKSRIKLGVRNVNEELTLNRVMAIIILLIILIGVNGLLVAGHHDQIIGKLAVCCKYFNAVHL